MAIDTLKVARRLQEAGFNEAQAEAVVAAVQQGAEGADLATKADLALLATELRAETAALRGDMREMEQRLIARITADLASAKSEILVRMLQMILSTVLINVIAIIGALFAFAKLLGH